MISNFKLTPQSCFALLLSGLLAHTAVAQDAGILKINVMDGNNAVNNIRRKAITPVRVEVRDEHNKVMPGARVRFTMPSTGPGGSFPDGSRSYQTWTDEKGFATMTSFVPAEQEGRFSLAISANLAGRDGVAMLSQTNSYFNTSAGSASLRPQTSYVETPRKSGSSKRLLIILGVGAAAAAGGLLAVRGNDGARGAGSTPTSVSLGGINVGGPH